MITENLSCTLSTLQDQTLFTMNTNTISYDGYNQSAHDEVSMPLRAANSGGEGTDAAVKVAYGINPQGGEMNPCDKELGQMLAGCHQNGVLQQQAIGFKAGQSANGGLGDEREVAPTITNQPSALEPTVASFVRIGAMTRRERPTPPSEEVAQPLAASDGNIGDNAPVVIERILSQMRYIVRRLTPTECERLMGLPQEPAIRIGQMTNDEYVAFELQQGNIAVDFNTGYVYSMRKHRGIRTEPHRLKGTDIRGYIHHRIVDGKQRRNCRAHRIVWIAANGIPPEWMVIDHINNDKSDNRLCNLQLLTPEDNSHKAHDDGLYLCGDENPASKLTEEERNEIRMLYATGAYSYTQLAEKFNISKARIAQLARSIGYTIPVGLDPNDPALVAEFQRIFDTYNSIMHDYAHAKWEREGRKKKEPKPPKPKSAKQVAAWLAKVSDPATCPDSPRYKSLGNGMATNQVRWIFTRLLTEEGVEW